MEMSQLIKPKKPTMTHISSWPAGEFQAVEPRFLQAARFGSVRLLVYFSLRCQNLRLVPSNSQKYGAGSVPLCLGATDLEGGVDLFQSADRSTEASTKNSRQEATGNGCPPSFPVCVVTVSSSEFTVSCFYDVTLHIRPLGQASAPTR